jgi:hypothetical protein
MSDFHDFTGVTRMDFDANVDDRKDVVIQLPVDKHDPEQGVCIVAITSEGIIMDFYSDGELVKTIGKTYLEWFNQSI